MNAITGLDLRLVRLSFREPVRVGLDWVTSRDVAIVVLEDESGLVGLGETFEQPHSDAVATARSWALGRTPMELLVAGGPWTVGVLPHRLCGALDTALADLDARQSGVSLARSLAGEEVRADVPVNALLVVAARDVTAPAAARRLVADGFGTIKLKLEGGADGTPETWWAEAIAGIRDVVGPDVALRVDLNGCLSADAARAWLPTLLGLRLEHVEQPIAPDHGAEALASLRDTGVPVAADESVVDLPSALDLIDAGCDTLVVKPARVGGPLRAAEVVEAANDAGVTTVISTLYETGVGLATALHVAAIVPGERAHGLATAGLVADDVSSGLPPVVRGRMAVPGPGLGVELP
ncbi:MAG: mandelate racemase/muconate lactonizing enzyme family protein [Chloroflexota bacterium]